MRETSQIRRRWLELLLTGIIAAAVAMALSGEARAWDDPPPVVVSNETVVPRMKRPPSLEDFLTMAPSAEVAGTMAKVTQFVQRAPSDGSAATQRTEAYLGYDEKNFYAVFVAFDAEPRKIRARLSRREDVFGDDSVQLMLDSFHDRRRAYSFICNPLGVQFDAIWTEENRFDDSFDTVWNSRGQLTPQGYVVWMAIPFKSLRFSSQQLQTWGIFLNRGIPRNNEDDFWPQYSSRKQGRLNQEGELKGLEGVSPGRNMQFIPYGVFRTFRSLDDRDPAAAKFTGKRGDLSVGLDSKVVLHDSMVLDVTANPDFSQVESDEPQPTVNQRFEVYFPEKRPFFLENASFFQTPIDLYFTRRIADPKYGVRLTGKQGPYSMGFLVADDESPGKSVPDNDPLRHSKAYFAIGRVNRDISKQSTVGAIYADREYEGGFNRVGGVDTRIKLPGNWTANAQAVVSSSRDYATGAYTAGPAFELFAQKEGRKLFFNTFYQDASTGFHTETGFFRRPDFRRFSNFGRYRWRPEGKHLVSHGPGVFELTSWDHTGQRLEYFSNANWNLEFRGQTFVGAFVNGGHENLRPIDFSVLTRVIDLRTGRYGVFLETSYLRQVTISGEVGRGTEQNYVPQAGAAPRSDFTSFANLRLTLRPISSLKIDNTYYFQHFMVPGGASSFNNHILRSKWNYQITRELSVRAIAQYSAVLANPNYSSLTSTKSLNGDFLVTYLLHPGTAVYVGYNSNVQNLDPRLIPNPVDGSLLRTRDRLINDGRQFFVKVSYQLRY